MTFNLRDSGDNVIDYCWMVGKGEEVFKLYWWYQPKVNRTYPLLNLNLFLEFSNTFKTKQIKIITVFQYLTC